MALAGLTCALITKISLLVILLCLLSCSPNKPIEYDWALPAGFPAPLVPKDNPMSVAKVELGKRLFFDSNLSFNRTMSCATCHQPEFSFAENKSVSTGATGQTHRRNAQTLVNIAYHGHLTWAHSGLGQLEQQILIPMFSEQPIELGITGHEDAVLARFANAQYAVLFEQAFEQKQPTFDHIVKALASYVRSLTSFDSPFDRYAYQNQDQAMSPAAIRGMDLFFSEKFECFHCHGGFNFSQSSQHENQLLDLQPFHNTGLFNLDGKGAYPLSDRGLIETTLKSTDMGKFRAPSLRNVQLSAPYMHDGSLNTLEDVIDFYAAGGRGEGTNNPLKSPFVIGFVLQDTQKSDLIAFLQSLTDQKFIELHSNPSAIPRSQPKN